MSFSFIILGVSDHSECTAKLNGAARNDCFVQFRIFWNSTNMVKTQVKWRSWNYNFQTVSITTQNVTLNYSLRDFGKNDDKLIWLCPSASNFSNSSFTWGSSFVSWAFSHTACKASCTTNFRVIPRTMRFKSSLFVLGPLCCQTSNNWNFLKEIISLC